MLLDSVFSLTFIHIKYLLINVYFRLLARVINDKRVVSDYLISLCVRLFVEKRETQITVFISEFQSASLADEKSDLLETFLVSLCTDMERDPNWQCIYSLYAKHLKIYISNI